MEKERRRQVEIGRIFNFQFNGTGSRDRIQIFGQKQLQVYLRTSTVTLKLVLESVKYDFEEISIKYYFSNMFST